MHCKVEGRGAYDILKNFEERWKRQALKKISYLAKVGQLEKFAVLSATPSSAMRVVAKTSTYEKNMCILGFFNTLLFYQITSSKYILRGSTAHNKSNKWTLQLFRLVVIHVSHITNSALIKL